ncbi:MAG: hypothetical protein ABJA85_07375 [Bacteroidota bacterium]
MKKNISIKLKAALLVVVFGLNTAVGFACAIGLDMSFNNTHHHGEEAIEVHVHADGKKHHHETPAHRHNDKNKDGKGGCCNNSIIIFSQADKSVPQSNIVFSTVFFPAFFAIYYGIDISYPSQVSCSSKYFVRSYHPPIPDIRISIQSFQI